MTQRKTKSRSDQRHSPEAPRGLLDARKIRLNAEEQATLVEGLLTPPAPGPRLLAAARRQGSPITE